MTNLIKEGQTMSSKQIAEVTGKQHKDVLRAIRNMEPAWTKITRRKFALCVGFKKLANNAKVEYNYYELTKTECLYIATKFNDEARARLILRWEQLETERLRQPTEAKILPSPIENQQVTPQLVEYVDGKAVTTSRKIARILGREHGSVIETIKDNLGNRAFKYGKFIRRPYSCGVSHGYEFLITRPGFDALVSLMRNGAKPKLREAYKYAWGKAPAALPSPAEPVETVEAEESKQKCLPGLADTDDVLAAPDETSAPEVDSEYTDWLEKYNDELGTKLSKARETMRLYSDLYTEAREQRQRVLDELGRASNLYGDLVMRLSALQSEEVDRCLNAHREFRARLTGKVNLS